MRSLVLTFAIIATALLCAAPAGAGTPPMPADARVINVSARGAGTAHQHITLALDKAAIVQLDTDARDVLVSNPGIVDAVVRTARRVYLLGMKTGQTNAFFFDAAGKQVLALDISVERDVAGVTSLMHANFPGSDVKVTAMNDNLVLTGTVASAQDATRAQDLAARFATDAGKSADPTKVVNMLKVKGREQVLIRVRVSEIQRNIAKQLGINLTSAFSAGGVPIIAATSNPFGLGQVLSAASGAQVGSIGNNPLSPSPNNVQGILNALDQVGLDHTLAEPNLTAVSGETAKFLAGGEFPVPVSRDLYGNVTIEFKQFGVSLAFTPVVLSENRISLQVSTEVSELTNEGAFVQAGGSQVVNGQTVQIASLTVPALAVRRAETTVELPSGGSFAIAGLLQHTTKQVLDEFPGLGAMPVLGALFRSRDFQNNETELVVIASAYLVDPTHETKLAAPTDGFIPATDVQQDLLGSINRYYVNDPNGLKSAADGKAGFIVE
jgi:pilus assembly protein CpaC